MTAETDCGAVNPSFDGHGCRLRRGEGEGVLQRVGHAALDHHIPEVRYVRLPVWHHNPRLERRVAAFVVLAAAEAASSLSVEAGTEPDIGKGGGGQLGALSQIKPAPERDGDGLPDLRCGRVHQDGGRFGVRAVPARRLDACAQRTSEEHYEQAAFHALHFAKKCIIVARGALGVTTCVDVR